VDYTRQQMVGGLSEELERHHSPGLAHNVADRSHYRQSADGGGFWLQPAPTHPVRITEMTHDPSHGQDAVGGLRAPVLYPQA